MKDTPKRLPVAEQIRKGLEEAIRHARGEITLKTTYELPEEPPEIDAETLVALRDQSMMSQAVFARVLNVSDQDGAKLGARGPDTLARLPPPDPDLQPAPGDGLFKPRPSRHHSEGGNDPTSRTRPSQDRDRGLAEPTGIRPPGCPEDDPAQEEGDQVR